MKYQVTQLKSEPENDVKLQLYCLFKQATVGPNTTAEPGMLQFVAKVTHRLTLMVVVHVDWI